jgi:hypothetical protein
MKVEVGKYYKTRNGDKAYVTGASPFKTARPFTVVPSDEEYAYVVYGDGAAFYDCESLIDLVAPWPEEIAVEVWIALHNSGRISYGSVPLTEHADEIVGVSVVTGKITKGVFE